MKTTPINVSLGEFKESYVLTTFSVGDTSWRGALTLDMADGAPDVLIALSDPVSTKDAVYTWGKRRAAELLLSRIKPENVKFSINLTKGAA